MANGDGGSDGEEASELIHEDLQSNNFAFGKPLDANRRQEIWLGACCQCKEDCAAGIVQSTLSSQERVKVVAADIATIRLRAGTSIVGLWSKIRWSVAQRGLIGTLQVLARRSLSRRSAAVEPVPHPFDIEHGVETSGLIGGGELTTGHAHDVYITAYAGIAPSRFQGMLRRWMVTPPLMPAERYSLADLGCGKGRALLLACEMPFREVIGVELNPELARIAQANLEIWLRAGKAKAPVRVVCGDATEWELPPGPCLILLFNPFGAPVMRRLLKRLEARGGTVDVLYQNPEQAAVFAEFDRFERLWDEVIPISAADAAVDPVARTVDRCVLFRLRSGNNAAN